MGQADPILTRLGAGPAVKKLVETALALSSSRDPQQRNHAYSFMESAIKELEDGQGNLADPGLGPDVDDDLNAPKLREEKDDDERKIHEEEDEDKEDSKLYKKMHEEKDEDNEHKVHEEVLDNHNNGPREDGSEQSTDNVAPYSQQGIDTTSGEKPMQDMDDTVNQWSETNGMIVPGLPPIQQNAGMGAPQGGMPGLAPDIAQEMGMQMPAPPPMDTNQMMRQMQYTIRHEMKNYDRKVVAPMMRHLKAQREALKEQKNVIRKLSIELRETKTTSGNMKLDLDSIRDNATAKFRETEPTIPGFTGMGTQYNNSSVAVQPLPNYQRVKVAVARSEIEQMDKILNSNRNPPIYN